MPQKNAMAQLLFKSVIKFVVFSSTQCKTVEIVPGGPGPSFIKSRKSKRRRKRRRNLREFCVLLNVVSYVLA